MVLQVVTLTAPIGDGNFHRHNNLPCLMAGKLGGQFETGRHLAYKMDTLITPDLSFLLHHFAGWREKTRAAEATPGFVMVLALE
jgi:hypothetical protein